MAIIHKGFIDKKYHDSFKDTGLNDTDIATTKMYRGVKPMWKHLGFADDSYDNPGVKFYWNNIIPKHYKFKPSNLYGLTKDTVYVSGSSLLGEDITTMDGMKVPRTSYDRIVINESSDQSWKGTNEFGKQYYYPVLPRVSKYGVFTDMVDEVILFGSKTTWNADDDSAPITNLNEVDDNLILNIDFDQTTTDDLGDKTNLTQINYTQDFEVSLDDDLRIKTDTLIIPDGIEKDNLQQAF